MNRTETDFSPPFAGVLVMLLATGYNLLSSILELIDNSVSKNSRNVRTIVQPMDKKEHSLIKWICVLDDGMGMTFNQLKEAFIICFVKSSRTKEDIGKYSVGMKSAVMNMGSRIVILSKTLHGDCVGIYADIEQMKDNNTYTPTRIVSCVTDEFIKEHIPIELYNQFNQQSSGTLILVKDIITGCQCVAVKALDILSKGIADSYSGNINGCNLTLESNDKVEQILLRNIFYDSEPNCLDEPAYETELLVFRGEPGYPDRVFEKNTARRNFKKNAKTTGTHERPSYYEFKSLEKGGNYSSNMFPVLSVPSEEGLIGKAQLRIIQVNTENFNEESQHYSGSLESDRKGVWFDRGPRRVGRAKRLGKKLHDRTSMAAERQRARLRFQPELDEAIGSKFNKQMEDQQLPCQPLNDAIFSIFKQVTTPWTKKWTPKTEVKEDSSVTDEFEDVDELPIGGSNPVREVKSVQKIQGSSVLTSITNAVMDEESATESIESSGSIPSILNTATVTEIVEDQVQEVYEEEEQVQEEEQGQVQEKAYTIENNYFKVMNGREVIAKMPYSPGLENWVTTVKLPTGKTIADFVKHSSTFWGIE
jgi:hypothetical protein